MKKRLILLVMICVGIFFIASCKDEKEPDNNPPTPVEKTQFEVVFNSTGGSVVTSQNVEEGGKVVEPKDPQKANFTFKGWFKDEACLIPFEFEADTITKTTTLYAKWEEIKVIEEEPKISVSISGADEVRASHSINLSVKVEGTADQGVYWEIVEGNEYVELSNTGVLKSKLVEQDTKVKIKATSAQKDTAYAEKTITIKAAPVLTEDMLSVFSYDKLSFEGYVKISLYNFGAFESFVRDYNTDVKTFMDGTHWSSEYTDNNTGVESNLYYSNHNNVACQVGVSLMNVEEYAPMLDDNGREISWADSGLYNSLKAVKVDDFEFNYDTWRYEYSAGDVELIRKVIASANPYDFVPTGFSLLLEDNEIIGLSSTSEPDYTIAQGYKAIQELTVAINYGDAVTVPTIAKFSYEAEVHDPLKAALTNMHALQNYTLDYKEIMGSAFASGYTQAGFVETITENDCYYQPYSVSYDSSNQEVHTFKVDEEYGFHKFTDNLYNSYHKNEQGAFKASRAFQTEFNKAKPTFAFAPEIFRNYYIDEEAGEITYYVAEEMSTVASTLYYGVGNDINLYGIFATRGFTSSTESFTPYVVVKDQYIVRAGFYFNLGSLFGVIELSYSNFNTAKLPEEVNISFEQRNVPTSWDELDIQVSSEEGTTASDTTTNAAEYLKTFYGDEDILNKMPFFGDVLGDTYGFGLTTIHMPTGTTNAKQSVMFYYDVPLDLDYTIESSLRAVKDYLISLGFVNNGHDEFVKGDIVVAPIDSSLDLTIYIWRVSNN